MSRSAALRNSNDDGYGAHGKIPRLYGNRAAQMGLQQWALIGAG
jgi:hypothetical protein